MIKSEQIRHLKEIATTYKVPNDLIDFEALVDSKLSYDENKSLIVPLIEGFSSANSVKEKVEVDNKVKKISIKAVKEDIDKVEMDNLRAVAEHSAIEFEKSIQEIKENKSEILEKLYKIPREYLKSVIKGTTISLILLGKQARGKSYLALETLKNADVKFKYHSGFTSPMALYKLLYENRDENIINVFDDTQGLMSNSQALPIMLNALYSVTNKREIMWNTTSSKLEVPVRFVYNAKTILITNELPKNINSTLISSRCLTYEFKPTNRELMAMMFEIAKLKSDIPVENRLEIVDFIKDYADGTCKNFDLRVQNHIESLWRYDNVNWRELAKPLLSRDENLVILKTLLGQSSSIKEAEAKYCAELGTCRATFYNRKKELENGLKNGKV